MNIVSGDRATSSYFIYEEHIYCIGRRHNGVLHLKCKFSECPATGIFCEGDDYIRILENHTHDADRDEVDRLLFRNALREEASLSTLDFHVLYNDLAPRYVFAFVFR